MNKYKNVIKKSFWRQCPFWVLPSTKGFFVMPLRMKQFWVFGQYELGTILKSKENLPLFDD